MNNSFFKKLGGAVFILTIGLALLPSPVMAAQNTNATGQGFQISPVLVELNADPGQTYVIKIKLKNVTANTLVSKSQVNNFGSKGENGDPEIFIDDSEKSTYALKNWVGKIPDYTFASQETRTIPISIDVPANAEPGGHYGVIRFSGVAPDLADDQNAVALSASIGTLVLVRVSGDVKEGASVEEFFASQNGQKSIFFEQGPINLVERIKNTGNVHIKPSGSLTIKNMFGQTIATLKVNDPPKNILPGSIRRFEQQLEKKWLFGRYNAQIDLSYGTTGQVLKSTLVFWVIPWKLILAVLALLTVVYLILRSGTKKYNAHIIAKSKRK